MNIIEEILMKFSTNNSLYIGEKVTISEHMIQSAMLAEKNNCSDNLICACLLHDYGHFILDDPDTLVSQKKDGEHEEIAYNYLKDFFVKDVVEPIRYHVTAKRYLARDKKYFSILSEASKISLDLQGGVMSDAESIEFQKNNYFDSSIKLKKFDDGGKKAGLKIKLIEEYKNLLSSKLL